MNNIIPDDPQKIVGRAVILKVKAPTPMRAVFGGVYTVVVRKRWWVPLKKRVRLRDIDTGEHYRIDYGVFQVFFELVPEIDSDKLYDKVLTKINKLK